MKGLGAIALTLALMVGLTSATAASEKTGQTVAAKTKTAKAKKKCKKGLVRRQGKCRHRVRQTQQDNSPRDYIRATLTWQGDANLDLIVLDDQDRVAGYSSSAGAVVNQIPDATHGGDVVAGGTETFVDHIWHPNPFLARNRHFYFGACAREVGEPVTATLTFVGAFYAGASVPQHFDPPSGGTGAGSVCSFYFG